MLAKCNALSCGCAELTAFHSEVWSLRQAAVPSISLPALTSVSAFHGTSSLRHGPSAIVSVMGQFQPLVHGCAELPGSPRSPSSSLGRRAPNSSSSSVNARDDPELTQTLLQQRRLAHSLATTTAGPCNPKSLAANKVTGIPFVAEADAAGATAVGGWTRPTRHALLRLSQQQQVTAAQAAVALLRIANQDVRRVNTASGEGNVGGRCGGGGGGGRHSASGIPGAAALQLKPSPPPAADQQQPKRPPPPLPSHKELLEGLELMDQLALREALEVLMPLLAELSVGQLQKCLETLAAVRHPPSDPWFHEWLLASERQLQAADATEVYGMFIAMRVLHQRPQSQDWVCGAMGALSAHLPQLDAVQVVELLRCFADMALRPPEELLSRTFALLLPDLPQLQPRVVVDMLLSCGRLRVVPPGHVLNAAYSALTPAALAAAAPPALCRLAASLAVLRLQPPLGLLTSLVERADAVLRLAVAAAGADGVAGRGGGGGTGVAAVVAEPVGPGVASGSPAGDADAAGAVAAIFKDGVVMAAEEEGFVTLRGNDVTRRTLRPRRGRLPRRSAASTAAAAATTPSAASLAALAPSGGGGGAPPSRPLPPPQLSSSSSSAVTAAADTFTTPQLSRLLRDLRVCQAPLPPDWADLCGRFLLSRMASASVPLVEVSYLMRSAARCGLALPPGVVRVVAARMEASWRGAGERRRRWHSGEAAAAAVAAAEDGNDDGGGDDGGVAAICLSKKALGAVVSAPTAACAATGIAAAALSEGEGDQDEVGLGDGGVGDVGDHGDDDCDGKEAHSSAAVVPKSSLEQWTRQELSVAITALVPYAAQLPASLLSAMYDILYDNLERFDLPELTATLAALPLLALPPGAAVAAAAGSAHYTAAEAAPRRPPPPPALVASYLSCLRGRMHRMQPWQLSIALFAIFRLGARPDPHWMDAFLGQVYITLPYMNEIQVATVPWVVAKMSYRPQGYWIDRLIAAAAGRLSCFSPRHLCQLLWAVGTMGYCPESAWMERWLDKARAQFRTSDGRTLAALAWSLAMLGHRPDRVWLQELCEHLARRLQYTSPRAVANTLAALAVLGHRPDVGWMEAIAGHVRVRLVAATTPPAASSTHSTEAMCYSLQDLSQVCYSLARLGYSPSDAWLDAVATVAARQALLEPAKAFGTARSGGAAAADVAAAATHSKHIAFLMLALSRLRRRPPPLAWTTLLEGLYSCLPYASVQSLAVLVAAAATLRLPLPREHAGALLLATHRRMAAFSDRGLAMVFRGFVELGVDPGPRWLGRMEEVLLQRCMERQQGGQEQWRWRPRGSGLHKVDDDGDDDDGDVEHDDEEDEEGQRPAEQLQQQQQETWGLPMAPRERISMLWAAVMLETASLRIDSGKLSSYPFPLSRHPQQQQQQQPPAAAAAAADINGGYPPPPRWVKKMAPLQRPLRLAGLFALLLPMPEPTTEAPARRREDDVGRRFNARHGDGERGLRSRWRGGERGLRSRWNQLAAYSGQDLALLCWALGRLRMRQHPPKGSGGCGGGLLAALLAEVADRLAATARPRPPLTTSGSAPRVNGAGGRHRRTDGSGGSCVVSAAAGGAVHIVRAPHSALPAARPHGTDTDAATTEVEAAGGGAAAVAAAGAVVLRHGGGDDGGLAMAPRELAMACWGLSSIGMWPSMAWQATVAAAAFRMARTGGLPPRDLATVLAALARWRRHPRVRKDPRRRLRFAGSLWTAATPPPRGSRRTPRGSPETKTVVMADGLRLRTCTAALAKIALVDSAAHMLAESSAATPSAAAGGLERGYDARSLATLTWALANLGVTRRLPDPWVASFMPRSLRLLSQLPPSHRVTMLDSLSKLGLRPDAAWLEKAEQVAMHGGGLSLGSSYRGLEAALRRMSGGS